VLDTRSYQGPSAFHDLTPTNRGLAAMHVQPRANSPATSSETHSTSRRTRTRRVKGRSRSKRNLATVNDRRGESSLTARTCRGRRRTEALDAERSRTSELSRIMVRRVAALRSGSTDTVTQEYQPQWTERQTENAGDRLLRQARASESSDTAWIPTENRHL